ncbi:MAG TPA: hypothetical protein VG942_12835 [Hyphomonadaceae bacterium]|nr:hypothetical protein [Hyphomonadaceae bacterium]
MRKLSDLAGVVVLCALVLAGCMSPAPGGPTAAPTTGRALAQFACPQRIAEAHAWVNYMPGPGRGPRMLNVDIVLANATDKAIILKSDATTGDTLVLDIRTAPAAPLPGHLAYREPVPDQLYKRISLFCRGGEIHSIDHIERVF